MQQFDRYFLGATAFAFVVVWTTLGATVAILAAALCLLAANLERVLALLDGAARKSAKSPRQRDLRTRPLAVEDDRPHPLVPDDPSLVISPSP